MNRTLIRDATLVMPTEAERANVLIEGGRIAAVDAPSFARADEVVNARGDRTAGVIGAAMKERNGAAMKGT